MTGKYILGRGKFKAEQVPVLNGSACDTCGANLDDTCGYARKCHQCQVDVNTDRAEHVIEGKRKILSNRRRK
jgi:hypothetical protein